MPNRFGMITSSFALNEKDTVNAGVFVRDFSKALVLRKKKVFVLTSFKEGVLKEPKNVRIKMFKWLGQEKDLTAIKVKSVFGFLKICSLILAGRYAILDFCCQNKIERNFAFWAIPSGYFALIAKKKLKIPYDVWILGSDIWQVSRYPFGKKIVKAILKNADHVFADGLVLAKDAEKLSGARVDFLPSSRKLKIAKKISPPDIDRQKTNFVFIARWEKNKGIDILIKTINLLKDKKIMFHLFGDGNMKNEVDSLIEKYQLKPKFLKTYGYAEPKTVIQFLTYCNALVIPSRIESIPVIFSDAMACHCPVIANNTGDLKSLISKYQVGVVSEKCAPKSLAKAIRIFQKNNHQNFIKNTKKAARNFDISQTAGKYLKEIQ